jgi:predicted O-methyltransferase YrrM
MFIDDPTKIPDAVPRLYEESARRGFTLSSEPKTGALLRAIVATRPGGRFLELGTGTGVGTAWMLDGMDADALLTTVEVDAAVLDIARRYLGDDTRVTFHHGDGAEFLLQATPRSFDVVYADAWPGKFTHLDRALDLVRPGGVYFVDDLLPQPNWPADHAPRVPALVADLESRNDFVPVSLGWASGLMLLVRR